MPGLKNFIIWHCLNIEEHKHTERGSITAGLVYSHTPTNTAQT